jgi:hypothetical protein
MNSNPIRATGKALGTWMAIVAFVAFLTFAFSFLGTILCAVVIGMMMGASRHPKWQSIPVSLIFPALVLLLLRLSRTELAHEQINAVAALCFGAFWLTYGLTFVLRSVEGMQAIKAKAAKPGATAAEKTVSTPACAKKSSEIPHPASIQALELRLEMLQGWWEGRTSVGPQQRRRTLEIIEDQIEVKELNAEGGICWEAKGGLRVDQSATEPRLVCLPAASDGLADAWVMI